MKLEITRTKLTRASDVVIPDVFFNRMKTSVDSVDAIFGDGILPGSSFTVAAPAGTGKTTFLMQLCQQLTDKDYRTGFISGEERIEMLALACRRLDTNDVCIAAENRLSEIMEMMKELDIIIIDSLPSIRWDLDDDKLSGRRVQIAIIEQLIKCGHENKCSIGVILHMTKMGVFKGGTEIIHAVDANINILKDKDDDRIRVIGVEKNRLGTTGDHSFYFGTSGYDFATPIVQSADDVEGEGGETKRGGRIHVEMAAVSAMIEPPIITLPRVVAELQIDEQRAKFVLWKMVSTNKLIKYGRGAESIWKHIEPVAAPNNFGIAVEK